MSAHVRSLRKVHLGLALMETAFYFVFMRRHELYVGLIYGVTALFFWYRVTHPYLWVTQTVIRKIYRWYDMPDSWIVITPGVAIDPSFGHILVDHSNSELCMKYGETDFKSLV